MVQREHHLGHPDRSEHNEGSEGLLRSRWPCLLGEARRMKRRRSCPPIQTGSAAFAGFRFPPEVILLAVRWAKSTWRTKVPFSDLRSVTVTPQSTSLIMKWTFETVPCWSGRARATTDGSGLRIATDKDVGHQRDHRPIVHLEDPRLWRTSSMRVRSVISVPHVMQRASTSRLWWPFGQCISHSRGQPARRAAATGRRRGGGCPEVVGRRGVVSGP